MTAHEVVTAIEASARAGHTQANFAYTNHRGETAQRVVFVGGLRLWFGRTSFHPNSQWLLDATDAGKKANRDFAIADMSEWSSA